jgi:tetratricopeptide (TPR) repeat protein
VPFRSWKLGEAASGLRYDRSGERLAAKLGNQLVVWNTEDGSLLSSIPRAGDFLGFDSSGERLFSRPTYQKISVWRTETGDLMCEIALPFYPPWVSISPDGMRIALGNLLSNHLLELRPLDEKGRRWLEARNIAAHLLKFPTLKPPYALHTKAELLAQLSSLATISEDVRRFAAELIEDFYTPEEEAWQFGSHGEKLIWHADKPEAVHQEGLKSTKAAFKVFPELWEFHYGFALYRVGRYQEAFEAIENSYAQMIERYPQYISTMLSVRAMAQFRVGLKDAAIETLVAAKTDPYANLPESLVLVREARALIEPDNRGEEDMEQGNALARDGQWHEAITAFARAEQQLAGNLRAQCLYYLAHAHYAAGDREAHKQVCRQLASDFDIVKNAFAADRLAYASVFNPDAFDEWSALVEASEKHPLQNDIRAALLLRAGNHDAALELLPRNRGNAVAWNLAFIAMTEHHAGHIDEARKALAACEKSLSEEAAGRKYSYDWHGLLAGRLLYEEAKRLITGQSP